MPLVFLDARVDATEHSVGTDNHVSIDPLMVDYLLRSGAPPSYFDMPRSIKTQPNVGGLTNYQCSNETLSQ